VTPVNVWEIKAAQFCEMHFLLKYFIAWFPMLVIAMGNGLLREFVIKKYLQDLQAHQLSTFTLIAFFSAYIWWIVRTVRLDSGTQAAMVGGMWLILTLCFEFGFGRYRGNSWETLLADYNLLQGRLWILIPSWVAIAPYLFFRLGK